MVDEAAPLALPVEAMAGAPAYRPRHAAKPDYGDDDLPVDEVPVGPVGAAEAAPAPGPSSNSLAPDRDLALNQPGAAARHHAVALRKAAPVHNLLSRAFRANSDERTGGIGAEAELEIAGMLQGLDGRWRVLHAVPVGDRGSEVDYVVVGPAGVFTINTKHHPDAKVWVGGDTFKVNGHNQRYVRTSRHEAARAAKLLSARAGFDVDVRGIIAVVGAGHGLMVKEQPPDGLVTVVTAPLLVKHLLTFANVLGTPSRDRIYNVARHLATWQPKTVGWTDF
jgi:hypothetical protein